MIVEIWSDYKCPFCYIGKRRFEAALDRFPNKEDVQVIYRSFELDPNSKRDTDVDVHDYLASKYGMSRQQAMAMNENVAAQARAVGLTFRFDTMIMTNTFDAHRLTHFAAERGKMHAMAERLFKAYFTESRHLGDHGTLAELAAEAGLDQTEALRALAGDAYTAEVRSDEQEAAELGIRAVPFFVINRKYGISGAQAEDSFLEALQTAWDEENPATGLDRKQDPAADGACDDGVCNPPRP